MSRNSFLTEGKVRVDLHFRKVCNTVLVDMIILTDFLISLHEKLVLYRIASPPYRFQIKFQAYLVHNAGNVQLAFVIWISSKCMVSSSVS